MSLTLQKTSTLKDISVRGPSSVSEIATHTTGDGENVINYIGLNDEMW